jgi:hypothetical protein
MRRALGTLTEWDIFEKATEVKLDGFNAMTIDEAAEESARTEAAVEEFGYRGTSDSVAVLDNQ